ELNTALLREKRQEKELQSTLKQEQETSYYRNIALADREWWANNVDKANQILDDCKPIELRGWEWHYLNHQCRRELLTIHWRTDAVNSVAFSPDGTMLLAASGRLSDNRAKPGELRIWDSTTGHDLFTLKHQKLGIFNAVFSP